MELSQKREVVWLVAAFGFVATILSFRLWAFGIWDPWELEVADRARHLLAGEDVEARTAPLSAALVASGFGLFGVREWAGRLPLVLAGLGAVGIAWLMVRRVAGARAGVYAAIVTGTTPLFLFNARQMLGDVPAMAAQALLVLSLFAAVFPTARWAGRTERARWIWTGVWLSLALVATGLCVGASGALGGALPPLVAVGAVAALRGVPLSRNDRPRMVGGAVVVGLAVVVVAMVLIAVIADHAEYSMWLGGRPRGGDPPTFEVGLEHVFHAFAPWSALLPLALGRMLVPASAVPREKIETPEASPPETLARRSEADLRLVLVLWAALGYGALTIYASRYGAGTYLPVVALAAAVALLLRDVERSASQWWTGAVVAAMLVGLLVRDFGLYPGGPIEGLGIEEVVVPEVFNPKLAWTLCLLPFAGAVVWSFGTAPGAGPLDVRAPYRLLRQQWQRGRSFKAWLIALAALGALLLIFGLVSFVAADSLGLTTLVSKWGKRIAIAIVVLPIAVVGGQAALRLGSKLGRYRMLPVLLTGALCGAYAAQGFLPDLSSHFSPREVYDTFNALAEPDAVLGEYRVGGRAATYYARGEVEEIENQADLVEFLSTSERRWAAFPSDELPAVNRAFRRRNERHLFVADARSARVVLATNQSLEGRDNQNFVAQWVRDTPPARIQFPSNGNFEDKIAMLGYDLDLPHGGHVGAGESFTITWYFRVLAPIPGSYKPFVHIDGQGLRLNGDHDPVDGRYPLRLWDEGDIVVDQQELDVPANYRPGPYTIYLGFFAGNNRLEVTQGAEDDANRLRAGILQVR